MSGSSHEWLATDTITAVARVSGFDGLWCVPGSPVPQHGRRPARDPARARARRSLPRHLRRVPARGDRVRAQRDGLGRRRARRERAAGRACGHLAARLLADRGERPSSVARRHPHRECLWLRPRDRGVPLQLRGQSGVPGRAGGRAAAGDRDRRRRRRARGRARRPPVLRRDAVPAGAGGPARAGAAAGGRVRRGLRARRRANGAQRTSGTLQPNDGWGVVPAGI